MKPVVYLLLPALLTLCACGGRTGTAPSDPGDTLTMKYARLLTVVRHKHYTEATLLDPWRPRSVLHRYVLVPRTEPLPRHLPKGTVVRTPVERSVVFTTAHCQLLEYLGATDRIAGVADLQYILIPDIRRRVAVGIIADCGDAMAPALEKIIDLQPQALLLSPFENSGGYGKLDALGTPIVETADYMESTALGRAEWMKFYGMLFGCEQRADSLFRVVDSTYCYLKQAAQHFTARLSILTERKTGSVWYVPGGRSTVAQIIADAHGRYAFSRDTHSGSLALAFEQVLAEAGHSDIWLFKYNGQGHMTKADLLAEFHGYAGLNAFRNNRVYACNSRVQPYFEEVPFRPDYLLRELIILMHPELSSFGQLRYYRHVD